MTIESEEPSQELRAGAPKLRLSPHQEALGDALHRESPDLLTMYLGALYVLAQPENPDRFAMAAHNLRELMKRILHVRTEIQEGDVRLGDKVINLRNEWDAAAKATSCLDTAGKWSGPIDKPLARFLGMTVRFFEWFKQHHP